MPLNLELKARVHSFSRARKVAEKFARFQQILVQKDTYFAVPAGRLKLREQNGESAELIFYARRNSKRNRWSRYEVCPLKDPGRARKVLSASLGILAEVRKKRRLYTYRNARIHIDLVRELGSFIEFEVEVTRRREQALSLYQKLVDVFGIRTEDLVSGSYSDLVRE